MLMLHDTKWAKMVQKGSICGADVVQLWQIGNAEARKTEGADGAFVVQVWWCSGANVVSGVSSDPIVVYQM